MKKGTVAFVAVLLACFMVLSAGAGSAEGNHPSRIILYTAYRQIGWDDVVQVGCVDEDGRLWLLTGSDADLNWPADPEKQVGYLSACRSMTSMGEMDSEDLFDLKGLVGCTENQGNDYHDAADDAGVESSYGVRYDSEGKPELVLLGMSGDSCFENTDRNAQALYLLLRKMFPQVQTYAYEEYMGPEGFRAVSLIEFCGWIGLDLAHAVICGERVECEDGLIKVELDEDQQEEIRSLVMTGTVTGKANATFVTGGTMVYFFCDEEGNVLAALELYRGLLVWNDGMYYLK